MFVFYREYWSEDPVTECRTDCSPAKQSHRTAAATTDEQTDIRCHTADLPYQSANNHRHSNAEPGHASDRY